MFAVLLKHLVVLDLVKQEEVGVEEEEKLALLKMLIAECSAEFERLPLLQDVEILRSVLYSGVWTQYEMKLRREKEKGGAVHGQ